MGRYRLTQEESHGLLRSVLVAIMTEIPSNIEISAKRFEYLRGCISQRLGIECGGKFCFSHHFSEKSFLEERIDLKIGMVELLTGARRFVRGTPEKFEDPRRRWLHLAISCLRTWNEGIPTDPEILRRRRSSLNETLSELCHLIESPQVIGLGKSSNNVEVDVICRLASIFALNEREGEILSLGQKLRTVLQHVSNLRMSSRICLSFILVKPQIHILIMLFFS
ncbi:hypothetical protein BC829DRAFT_40666 [Chytridium lagenaria]|nr:hypothetical protein BC829DRAFT_40666 [Chytridium lagenaria]